MRRAETRAILHDDKRGSAEAPSPRPEHQEPHEKNCTADPRDLVPESLLN